MLDKGGNFVVLDTTKVQIFKQITTRWQVISIIQWLFQIPQRYRFSSKSQHHFVITSVTEGCFRYHKGTDFQANHNPAQDNLAQVIVVLDTTKVQIFKQITTQKGLVLPYRRLFQIPQRYRFSSKSQRCSNILFILEVVLDTTKVQIFIKYNRETC